MNRYYVVKEDVSCGRTDKKYYNNIAVYESEQDAKELFDVLNKLSQGLSIYIISEEQEEFVSLFDIMPKLILQYIECKYCVHYEKKDNKCYWEKARYTHHYSNPCYVPNISKIFEDIEKNGSSNWASPKKEIK